MPPLPTGKQFAIAGLVGAGASYFTNIYTFSAWINKVRKPYVSLDHSSMDVEKLPMVGIMSAVPLAYAGANVLAVMGASTTSSLWERLAITGAVGSAMGIGFSIVGRFGLGMNERVFGVYPAVRLHLMALLLYFVLFMFVVGLLNEYFVDFQE